MALSLFRALGRIVAKSTEAVELGRVALASASQTCLELVKSGFAEDAARLKQTLLLRSEAITATRQAEALEKLLKASELAHSIEVKRRHERMIQIEREARLLQQADSDENRQRLLDEFQAAKTSDLETSLRDLKQSIVNLNRAGGSVAFDPENLRNLIAFSPKLNTGEEGNKLKGQESSDGEEAV